MRRTNGDAVGSRLSDTPRGALAGVCAAVLPPESGGPDATVLAARVERYLRLMPAINRRALMAGCHGLDALALATTGRRLTGLDPERRTGVLRRALRMGEAGEAVVAVKAMVLLVAGAESAGDVLLARARATPPVRPDAHLDVTPARWWPSRSRCDVVVIGSGAGGAFGARTLARAGLDTVVIEEGRRFTVEEFRERPAIERFAELYRDAGSTIAIGRPPVVLPIGRGGRHDPCELRHLLPDAPEGAEELARRRRPRPRRSRPLRSVPR